MMEGGKVFPSSMSQFEKLVKVLDLDLITCRILLKEELDVRSNK